MAWKAKGKQRKHKNGEAAEWVESTPQSRGEALEGIFGSKRHPVQFQSREKPKKGHS